MHHAKKMTKLRKGGALTKMKNLANNINQTSRAHCKKLKASPMRLIYISKKIKSAYYMSFPRINNK